MTKCHRYCLSLILLFSAPFLLTPIARAQDDDRIYVIFRYDDYSSKSATGIETTLIELFQRYRAGYTFSVIPYVARGDEHDPNSQGEIPLSEEKAVILRDAIENGRLEVALHGLSHRVFRRPLRAKLPIIGRFFEYSEFEGVPFHQQLDKIGQGKSMLEEVWGFQISTFVPPWETYDRNTVKALERSGIYVLSSMRLLHTPAIAGKTLFIPATCKIEGLKEAIAAVRSSGDDKAIVGVLYHNYDFYERTTRNGSINLEQFARLLQWCRMQKDIELVSIREAVQLRKDEFGATRFVLNKRLKWYSKIVEAIPLPERISGYIFGSIPNTSIYWSESYASHLWRPILIKLMALFLIMTMILFIAVKGIRVFLVKRKQLG